jgi:hypothetical protein
LLKAGPVKDRVVFFGDSITDMWKLENIFSGKAVCESRHRRADYAADAGAVSTGCDRVTAEGGGGF